MNLCKVIGKFLEVFGKNFRIIRKLYMKKITYLKVIKIYLEGKR